MATSLAHASGSVASAADGPYPEKVGPAEADTRAAAMRRWRLWGLALVGCLAVLLAFGWWLAQPQHCINAESIAKIQEGMDFQEVIELLGAEPGDYRTEPHVAMVLVLEAT